MQNELKSAIRFDDFYAVFGSQGVVALAWWLGAKLAEEIRVTQLSFPFLHITGGPGSGKSSLQSYLWKLLGEETFSACVPERATRAGRLRTIANAGQRKQVVTFDSMPGGEDTGYDWDELKDLYSSGASIHGQSTRMEPIRFHGAVVICSSQPIECSDALSSRMALVRMPAPSTTSRSHVISLQQLTAQQARTFGQAINQRTGELLDTINRLSPAYTASLHQQHGGQLDQRAAKNGGQLKALIDALSLLLSLSNEQRQQALNEVEYCVCQDFIPY